MSEALLIFLGVILVLLGRVLVGVLTAEIVASLPDLSRALVRGTARQLPPEHQERWREEFLGELETFGGRHLAALLWALDLRLGARAIAAELCPPLESEQPPIPHEELAPLPLIRAYCVRETRDVHMRDPAQVTMRNGRPAIQGACPYCGTRLFKIGSLEECDLR